MLLPCYDFLDEWTIRLIIQRALYSRLPTKVPKRICLPATKAKFRLIWPLCVQISLILGLVTPIVSTAQTNSVRLARVTYLTTNLDSAMRSFLAHGFKFEHSEFAAYGPVAVRLPCGNSIELESSDGSWAIPRDTSAWKTRALAAYGNHVAGVAFAVEDIPLLGRHLDSLGIPHGLVAPSGFGMIGTAPLDFVFVPREARTPTSEAGQNGYRRISWLVLTASDSSQALLRRVFDALNLRKLHEGCCDYWLVGPVDARTAIRFEIPSATPEKSFKPEGQWLSIEDGGIIFGY